MHRLRAAEAHLELGRVDVDVDLARAPSEEQHRDRVASAHQQRFVAVERGAQRRRSRTQRRAAGRSPEPRADVRPHQTCRRQRFARRPQEGDDPHAARLRRLALQHRAARSAAQHLGQALPHVASGRICHDLAPVVLETESGCRTRDRETREEVDDVAHLGSRRAQELPPRGGGGEEVADLHAGADGGARRPAGRAPPPSASIATASASSARRVTSRTAPAAAMLGSASPRKPRVATRSRSSPAVSLLVACRANARRRRPPSCPRRRRARRCGRCRRGGASRRRVARRRRARSRSAP